MTLEQGIWVAAAICASLWSYDVIRSCFRSFAKRELISKTPRLHELLSRIPAEWNREDFIICGSASLAFRGVRDVNDLDILVKPELQAKLYSETVSDYGYLINNGIEVLNPPYRIEFDDVRRDADTFEGFLVQSLQHTLAVKAMVPVTRDKDRPDMVALAQLIAKEPKKVRVQVAGDYRTGKVPQGEVEVPVIRHYGVPLQSAVERSYGSGLKTKKA